MHFDTEKTLTKCYNVLHVRRVVFLTGILTLILHKLFAGRMAWIFIYISNTTSKKDGYLWFHEIQRAPAKPSLNQRVNCSVLGRYVIYCNERRPNITYPSYFLQYAYNAFCDVEVYDECVVELLHLQQLVSEITKSELHFCKLVISLRVHFPKRGLRKRLHLVLLVHVPSSDYQYV